VAQASSLGILVLATTNPQQAEACAAAPQANAEFSDALFLAFELPNPHFHSGRVFERLREILRL
jgi:hypothetical protein